MTRSFYGLSRNPFQGYVKNGRPQSWLQFMAYSVCGAVATAVDTVVFYVLAWRWIPALGASDPLVRLLNLSGPFAVDAVEESVRSRNFLINRAIAFLFSNLAGYVLNARWVFQQGRHNRGTEVGLFYACSLFSVGMGSLLGWSMIRFAGWSTTLSYACNIVAAVLINFTARKHVVFKD